MIMIINYNLFLIYKSIFMCLISLGTLSEPHRVGAIKPTLKCRHWGIEKLKD